MPATTGRKPPPAARTRPGHTRWRACHAAPGWPGAAMMSSGYRTGARNHSRTPAGPASPGARPPGPPARPGLIPRPVPAGSAPRPPRPHGWNRCAASRLPPPAHQLPGGPAGHPARPAPAPHRRPCRGTPTGPSRRTPGHPAAAPSGISSRSSSGPRRLPAGRSASPPAAAPSPAPAATGTTPGGPGPRTRTRTPHHPATGPADHGSAPPAAAAPSCAHTSTRPPRRSADPAPARLQAAWTRHTRFRGRARGREEETAAGSILASPAARIEHLARHAANKPAGSPPPTKTASSCCAPCWTK